MFFPAGSFSIKVISTILLSLPNSTLSIPLTLPSLSFITKYFSFNESELMFLLNFTVIILPSSSTLTFLTTGLVWSTSGLTFISFSFITLSL